MVDEHIADHDDAYIYYYYQTIEYDHMIFYSQYLINYLSNLSNPNINWYSFWNNKSTLNGNISYCNSINPLYHQLNQQENCLCQLQKYCNNTCNDMILNSMSMNNINITDFDCSLLPYNYRIILPQYKDSCSNSIIYQLIDQCMKNKNNYIDIGDSHNYYYYDYHPDDKIKEDDGDEIQIGVEREYNKWFIINDLILICCLLFILFIVLYRNRNRSKNKYKNPWNHKSNNNDNNNHQMEQLEQYEVDIDLTQIQLNNNNKIETHQETQSLIP